MNYREKPLIAVDFDGTLSQYNGWKGINDFGPPIEGAREAMILLRERGYQILIWTTRGDSPELRKWFSDNDIPYDFINTAPVCSHQNPGKPPCVFYIDDRAIRFRGNWKETIDKLCVFEEEEERRGSASYFNPLIPEELFIVGEE